MTTEPETTTTTTTTTTTPKPLATKCSTLPDLNGGHWECHPDGPRAYEKKPSYDLTNGQKCSPFCAHGFELNGIEGSTVHRCVCNQKKGCSWNKDPESATCARESGVSLFAAPEEGVLSCPIPPEVSPEAGQWACDGMDGVSLPWARTSGSGGVRLKHGSRCMLQCNEEAGYSISNLNGRNVR